ncbi:MAG: FecR domain-containing protein [Saprospiraceae bacterium]|nr:FecR domain-containing protein [Saprospiraceae bacterium]MCF8252864.1 FecR domain-containing protein [Saprospiraceae bacterium]MCF8283315.1 FecR domain-containing protein [Bacteroidales bacterium]MCF8314416.1 FecR domain-containing protein [Saprospiraceae bacterium]MCF8443310.1 FecR domain-containing protein [Saprospiraceae bacterium]
MDHLEKYSALAAKYLAGQASPVEEKNLFAWADANADHQKLFEDWTETWALTEGAASSPFDTDLGAAWAKVDAAISEESPRATERPAPKIVSLSKMMRRWSVAAAILFAVAAATWWFNRQPAQPQLVEVQTFDHEKKQITLPDSSHVWLNENSKLAYNPRFEQRHVMLEGEAFFEVERLVERPFEIVSGSATTTVLGTSFNVRAYAAEEKIEVTVKTGKVALASNIAKHSPVLLAPGETGVFDKKEEKVEVAVHEEENADAWKTQQLRYDDEKMAQVIASLERYFGVEIKVSDPSLLECPYTSSFQQPDLESILTVIGSTIGFEFSKTGGRYLLTGKGCQ